MQMIVYHIFEECQYSNMQFMLYNSRLRCGDLVLGASCLRRLYEGKAKNQADSAGIRSAGLIHVSSCS